MVLQEREAVDTGEGALEQPESNSWSAALARFDCVRFGVVVRQDIQLLAYQSCSLKHVVYTPEHTCRSYADGLCSGYCVYLIAIPSPNFKAFE